MIVAFNILTFVFLLFLIKSPNKGVTSFQFIMSSIFLFIDPFTESVFGSFDFITGCIFRGLFIANLILWLLIGGLPNDKEETTYKIENNFNFISEPYIVLNFPWGKCDFSKVTLNPKFVVKYYQLEKLEARVKPKFSNFVIRTFLQEYFYFKSVFSFYLIKREKYRKGC